MEICPRRPPFSAATFAGLRRAKQWRGGGERWDFFGVKGVLDPLFAALRVGPAVYHPVSGAPFHPTRAAAVSVGKQQIGALGELHPDVCERFDVPEGTVAFELAVAPLLAQLPPRQQVTELDRYPAMLLDLALVVGETIPAEQVRSLIAAAGAPEVTRVDLFDVYVGEQVPEGKKSLAFGLELRVPDRTLTDEDAEAVTERILGAVRERTGAELRT